MFSQDWILILLLIAMLFALVGQRLFGVTIQNLFKEKGLEIIKQNTFLFTLFYFVLFGLLLSIFLFSFVQFTMFFGLEFGLFWNQIFLFFVVILGYEIWLLITRTLFLLPFLAKQSLEHFLFGRIRLYFLFSLVLIPINFVLYFSHMPVVYIGYFGWLILAIVLLLGLVQFVFIKKQQQQPEWYHNFLYFCATEFLPILVLIHYAEIY